MSKRALSAKLISKPIETFEMINYSARFQTEINEFFKNSPNFADRHRLHEHIGNICSKHPLTYLEFGVWKGETFKKWLNLNTYPESRFWGFDSFEGLPEDWEKGQPKGTFSTHGSAPIILDQRGNFIKGWFQDTLYEFLRDFDANRQIVVHIDCDLYSSTLFVLAALDRHIPPGTIFIFDDFSSMRHEFAAWLDYKRSFNREWEPVALVADGIQAAVRVLT